MYSAQGAVVVVACRITLMCIWHMAPLLVLMNMKQYLVVGGGAYLLDPIVLLGSVGIDLTQLWVQMSKCLKFC